MVSAIPSYETTPSSNDRSCDLPSNRFASRAEAAIVTDRQCRLVDPGLLSIDSNSSSQSTAESWACSGPCNSFTALMNAQNSRSAICICSLQIELENDSFLLIGSSSDSAMPRTGGFIPWSTRCLIDRWSAQV